LLQEVQLIVNATKIVGGYGHSCAILMDGTAQCWGYNNYGQLGRGSLVAYGLYPVSVIGISDATSVGAGRFHTCAALRSGVVQCWGSNVYGQLGNGTSTDSATPVTVSGITNAVTIGLSDYHSCAVLKGGSVKCWGENAYGELGDGTTEEVDTVPVTVVGF
jgi:alpha-tubulin suppressor-like RCC1 family protein